MLVHQYVVLFFSFYNHSEAYGLDLEVETIIQDYCLCGTGKFLEHILRYYGKKVQVAKPESFGKEVNG